MGQGPANEVPQGPRDAEHNGAQNNERPHAFGEADQADHGAFPCSAVAVPVPVTVRWSIPAMSRICVAWVIDTLTVTTSPFTATVPVCPAAAKNFSASAVASVGS